MQPLNHYAQKAHKSNKYHFQRRRREHCSIRTTSEPDDKPWLTRPATDQTIAPGDHLETAARRAEREAPATGPPERLDLEEQSELLLNGHDEYQHEPITADQQQSPLAAAHLAQCKSGFEFKWRLEAEYTGWCECCCGAESGAGGGQY